MAYPKTQMEIDGNNKSACQIHVREWNTFWERLTDRSISYWVMSKVIRETWRRKKFTICQSESKWVEITSEIIYFWRTIYYEFIQGVPYGVGGERWTCNPRVSGSIPGPCNLKKLLIWKKIHSLPQNHNKDVPVRW